MTPFFYLKHSNMEKEEIVQFNQKGEHHGYQQLFDYKYTNGRLWLRGTYNNGLEIGYEEWHRQYCEPQTNFYIR